MNSIRSDNLSYSKNKLSVISYKNIVQFENVKTVIKFNIFFIDIYILSCPIPLKR